MIERASSRSIDEGAFTSVVIQKYCGGVGIEIGPGQHPYGPPGTLMFDSLRDWLDKPMAIDAQALADTLPVADSSCDFLISSHCLEHCPDTLAVLREWRRVLRPGAALVLILPHGERTF